MLASWATVDLTVPVSIRRYATHVSIHAMISGLGVWIVEVAVVELLCFAWVGTTNFSFGNDCGEIYTVREGPVQWRTPAIGSLLVALQHISNTTWKGLRALGIARPPLLDPSSCYTSTTGDCCCTSAEYIRDIPDSC